MNIFVTWYFPASLQNWKRFFSEGSFPDMIYRIWTPWVKSLLQLKSEENDRTKRNESSRVTLQRLDEQNEDYLFVDYFAEMERKTQEETNHIEQ